MDKLKEFLAKKRKATDDGDGAPAAKRDQRTWARGAEVRAAEQARLRAEQEQLDRERAEARKAREAQERAAAEEAERIRLAIEQRRGDRVNVREDPLLKLSVDEIKRQLRSRGEVVTFFAETDEERLERLRRLRLSELDRLGSNEGRNDFKETADAERQRLLEEAVEAEKGGLAFSAKDSTIVPIYALRAPTGVEERVWFFLMRMFDLWQLSLESLPPEDKLRHDVKKAIAIHKQSRNYIEPLFAMLESRTVPADILTLLSAIVQHLEAREYTEALDSYLRLSIGNAAWPIGVTMVGIHERSGREKISAGNVAAAHILNNERDRKYIQSVKRVITFCQNHFSADGLTPVGAPAAAESDDA